MVLLIRAKGEGMDGWLERLVAEQRRSNKTRYTNVGG